MSRNQIYYPQGQIQNGLYTQGKEWMLENGTEYIGDYHRYATGEVFTISAYIEGKSQKLIPYQNLSNGNIKKKFEYDKLKDELKPFLAAPYGKELPTQSDYNRGSMTRYIVQRKSSGLISEVTSDSFSNIQEEHYNTLELGWKLTDDAVSVNQRIVLNAEKTIKGISNYITNYSEFVKV